VIHLWFITQALEHLRARCVDYDVNQYHLADIRRLTGLRHAHLRRLENAGTIPPIRRDENGHRVWNCNELISMLEKIEHSILEKEVMYAR